MKKTVLGLAVLSAVVFSHTVSAQNYDDRWYISGTAGVLGTDTERSVSNAGLFGVGIGKRFAPNMALDVQFDQSSPVADIDPFGPDLTWKMQSVQVVGRYYFQKEGRNWSPFIAGGLGVQRHREQYPDPGNGGASDINTRVGDDFIATLGAGLETERSKRVDYRVEAGLRYDNDQFEEDDNGQAQRYGSYMDFYAAASILVKLGNLAAPVVAAPAAPTCDTMDGDNDGVNDCNDRCPNSEAGQTIGADGCPVKLTIDLKGVNFDFDKDTLRPDAVVILDEAVGVLVKYPELRVEVAGHTDSKGTDAYNQDLSQRRAQRVYDYLTTNGVDAGRLVGPNGYGESRPIDTNDTDEGRANNRRTELNVQN